MLWTAFKEAGRMFYLHKVLGHCTTSRNDRVTVRTKLPEYSFRTFLAYKHILNFYAEDFKKYCPKGYLRYALLGMYFANLGGVKGEIFKILLKAIKIYPLGIPLAFPWALICLITPSKLLLKFYESFIVSSGIKERIKKLLTR